MKTQKQENFPVACHLFPRAYRQIITHYYNFARYCDDIADSPELSSQQKLHALDIVEQALYGKADSAVASLLRQDFLHEHLDFSLATDLLVAFRRDSENVSYQTWAQLLDYCQYSAAPVGRFMLALFNENPSTYLPASALCAVLQITNHLQDLYNDFHLLKRCYLPQEMMKHYKVSAKSIQARHSSKNLQFLLNDVLKRCQGLLKDAAVLPSIVKSLRLRLYVCITMKLAGILLKKLAHGDVLRDKIALSGFDWIRAFVLGCVTAIITPKKTLIARKHK